MLEIQLLRQEKEAVIEKLNLKNFDAASIVEKILMLDEERRKILAENETALAFINSASKNIGKLMAEGNKDEAEKIKLDVAAQKEISKMLAEKLADIETEQHDALVQLPNLPQKIVPPGKTPEENEVVKTTEIPTLAEIALPHWDLCERYQLVDFELGNKVTGAGFPFYKNQGAKYQRALIQYFLDFNTAAGYQEYQAPLMVNNASAYGTGNLPDKEGQMYYMPEDDFYMIPTAEVPLTNIFRNDILKQQDLPIKLTGYTPCFRREAGSHGKDVRGLNRLHQFDKVEIVQFIEPEKSKQAHDEMVAHVEKLIQSLELPYRILRLCGGDMSFASSLTYDFEVYSGAQKRWLECSSVSNFKTFQSNRMKIRYKDENNKSQLIHTLNGSSLALPRILACLLENFQEEDGIRIPKVLVPYFGKDKIML
ncbi:MAG: serine--tRNA ligase [Chitinophagaceae bacterium]|nr:serine--tRNA ligase [Chitinophagaceae bacterium]